MGRWFYICLLVSSALLLWLACNRRPPVEIRVAGVVDAGKLFEQDPDYRALRDLETEWLRISGYAGYAVHGIDTAADVRSMQLANELDRFRIGIESRYESVSAIRAENSLSRLKRRYRTLHHGHDVLRRFVVREAQQDMAKVHKESSAFRKLDSPQEPRFRLLNLKLQLETLTRDRFVMPESKMIGIREEVARIEKQIEEQEKARVASVSDDFESKSFEIRQRMESMQSEIETDLKIAIEDSLNESEQRLETLLGEEREKIGRITDRGVGARTVFSIAWNPDLKFTLSSPSFTIAEPGIRSEFMRRLCRKMEAVAEQHHLGVVYDTPYPAPGDTIDVTGDFMAPGGDD